MLDEKRMRILYERYEGVAEMSSKHGAHGLEDSFFSGDEDDDASEYQVDQKSKHSGEESKRES